MIPNKGVGKRMLTVVIAMAMLIITMVAANALVDAGAVKASDWQKKGRDFNMHYENAAGSTASALIDGYQLKTTARGFNRIPLVNDFEGDGSAEIVIWDNDVLYVLDNDLNINAQASLKNGDMGDPSIARFNINGEFDDYIAIHNNTHFFLYQYNDGSLTNVYTTLLINTQPVNLWGSGINCFTGNEVAGTPPTVRNGCVMKAWKYDFEYVWQAFFNETQSDGIADGSHPIVGGGTQMIPETEYNFILSNGTNATSYTTYFDSLIMSYDFNGLAGAGEIYTSNGLENDTLITFYLSPDSATEVGKIM